MTETGSTKRERQAQADGRGELTVQVYVRPELLLEPIDAKIETLQALEDEGVVDGLVVHSWPGEIELSPGPPRSEAVEAFERFEVWADARDVSVRPPFTVRTRSSSITGEERTVLSTPVMCLAVYVDGGLAGVFPHAEGEHHRSVAEAIATLRTGEFPATAPDTAEPPTDGGLCPDCDGSLVNVQGLAACHDCLAVTSVTVTRRRPTVGPAGAARW